MMIWSYGVFGDAPGALDKGLGGGSVKRVAAEDPGAVRKRMKRLDFGAFGSKSQCFGADPEIGNGFGEI